MKIIITESQYKLILSESKYSLLRRHSQIKDLVDLGIRTISRYSDICDFTTGEFLGEVCWQVSDEMGDSIPIDEIHIWVKDNFGDLVDHIEITTDKGRVVKSKYDILIDDRTKYVDKFVSAGGSAILYKDANQAASDLQKLYDELMSGN